MPLLRFSNTARVATIGLLLAAGTLLNGCAHPVSKKLQGRWLGEAVENFEEEDIAVATGWVRGTSFEFSGSELTVMIPAAEPRAGRFEVASAREGQVVLSVRDGEQSERVRFTLDAEHLMRWHLDDMRSVVLRREQ